MSAFQRTFECCPFCLAVVALLRALPSPVLGDGLLSLQDLEFSECCSCGYIRVLKDDVVLMAAANRRSLERHGMCWLSNQRTSTWPPRDVWVTRSKTRSKLGMNLMEIKYNKKISNSQADSSEWNESGVFTTARTLDCTLVECFTQKLQLPGSHLRLDIISRRVQSSHTNSSKMVRRWSSYSFRLLLSLKINYFSQYFKGANGWRSEGGFDWSLAGAWHKKHKPSGCYNVTEGNGNIICYFYFWHFIAVFCMHFCFYCPKFCPRT